MGIAKDPMAHIRAELMALPSDERAEYALDLLAFYLDPRPAFYDGCRALGISEHVNLPDLRVLHALNRRRGRLVSSDALLSARCIDQEPDDWDTGDKVVRSIWRLRDAFKTTGLPFKIDYWDDGYALCGPAEFKFEDAAPVDLLTLMEARA